MNAMAIPIIVVQADDLITIANRPKRKLQSLYGNTGQGFCNWFLKIYSTNQPEWVMV
jgi:hypothetical protein